MSGHDLIFQKIMMMVGLDNLESLHRCEQVCSTWNTMIMRNIWESPSKRNIIKMRIKKNWAPGIFPSEEEISHAKWLETRGLLDTAVLENLSSEVRRKINRYAGNKLPEITCAASLAHYGLLGSVRRMKLWHDLTSVPTEHLVTLASSVTGHVGIYWNVHGCDLITILDSVKSKGLDISCHRLGREETQALVRAMESRVRELVLYGKVTLDIRSLMEYSGRGKCRRMECHYDTAARYSDKLATWARSRNWTVTRSKKVLLIEKGGGL